MQGTITRKKNIILESIRQDKKLINIGYNTLIFLISTILSSVTILGILAPIGFSFTCASTKKSSGLYAILGNFVGYFILSGSNGIKYSAAALLAVATINVFRDFKLSKHPLFIPIISSICISITGFIFVYDAGFLAKDIILYISEISLSFGLVYFYTFIFENKDKYHKNVGLVLLVICLCLSISDFYILGVISPLKITAMTALLVISFLYNPNISIAAAMLTGLLFDKDGLFFTAAYAIIVLISSYMVRFSKIIFSAVFFLVTVVLSLWNPDNSYYMIAESLIAISIFLFIPDGVLDKLNKNSHKKNNTDYINKFNQQSKKSAVELSAAFYELGIALDRPQIDIDTNDGEINMIYDKTANKVCKSCYKFKNCWEYEYNSTYETLDSIGDKILKRGRANISDFPNEFVSRCKNFKQFLASINDGLNVVSQRHALNEKLENHRSLVASQYDGIKGILQDFSNKISNTPEILHASEDKVFKFTIGFGEVDNVYVYRSTGGRITTEITGSAIYNILKDKEKFIKGINLILGVELKEPELVCDSDINKLIIHQKEPYNALIGMALQKKDEEDISGDSLNYFVSSDGKAVIIITDGMGSGEQASIESAEALSILTRFIRSGISASDALKAVLPALKIRGESFVTVDIATIDLFSGLCEIVKWGAAPSYIVNNKGVRRVYSGNFADKILNTNVADVTRLRLSDGDTLVMMSDGISDGVADRWLVDILGGFQNIIPREICSSIIKTAKDKNFDDDMSCISIKLNKI